MKRRDALKIREILEAGVSSPSSAVSDALVSFVPSVCARLKGDGALIRAGTRICHNGSIVRAAVDLWDRAEYAPDAAPDLWAPLAYRDGYRIIPEVITTELAFAQGECGWWGEVLYRSLAEGNVYTPAVVPDNWEIVSDSTNAQTLGGDVT